MEGLVDKVHISCCATETCQFVLDLVAFVRVSISILISWGHYLDLDLVLVGVLSRS